MGAPKGNQFWKQRSTHGRDLIFASPGILWEAACEYFEWANNNPWIKTDFKGKDADKVEIPIERPLTMMGLCIFLGVNSGYFRDFKGNLDEKEKDFSSVIMRIEEIIYTQKFEGAAIGAFNANIIARDLGLADKIQNEVTNVPLMNVDPLDNSADDSSDNGIT